MGWKGESRRHSLARKGIKTNIDGNRRFDVSNFVAKGEQDEKSTFYYDGFDAGEFSAHVNLGEDQKELFEAYENDELGEIVGHIREIQVQYSGDISYEVRFYEEEIEMVEWLEKNEGLDPKAEDLVKQFGIDIKDADRIVYDWKNGKITSEQYDQWEDGFYDGFHRQVRWAFIEDKIRGVYDNGGKSVDRYSVILNDGSLIGMSDRPFHPQGFNQFAGNVDDWDLTTLDHLGKRIALHDIPEVIVDAIEQRIGDD